MPCFFLLDLDGGCGVLSGRQYWAIASFRSHQCQKQTISRRAHCNTLCADKLSDHCPKLQNHWTVSNIQSPFCGLLSHPYSTICGVSAIWVKGKRTSFCEMGNQLKQVWKQKPQSKIPNQVCQIKITHKQPN